MYNPECTDCILGQWDGLEHRCIPARMGHDERTITDEDQVRVLLVGQAPDETDDQYNKPFMGAAGGLLNKALSILSTDGGLDLATIGLTNAVKCRPQAGKNPPVAAKRECLRYFDAELEKYQPHAIVALGGQAISALTDGEVSAVGPNRLKVLEYRGLPMMVTFHPSAVLYDRTKAQDLLDDLYAYLIEEIWDKEDEAQNFSVRLVNDSDSFAIVRALLADKEEIAIDIETDGFTPHILTIAAAVDDTAYVLPAFHPESKLNGKEVVEWAISLLRSPDRTIVGQNVKYDLSMLMRAGGVGTVPVLCRTKDSMLFHYMLNEHSTARNLDYLSRAYTGIGGYKEDVNHGALAQEDLRTLARYNGRDAAVTPQIIAKITKQLEAGGYRSEAMERFYSRLTPFVATMEAAGIKVDRPRLAEVKEELECRLEELRADVEEQAPDVNLDSPKQLSNHLYKTLGLELPDVKDATTPAGQPSTREDVISHLKHPFVDALLDYRGTAKLLRTYVGGIEDNLWPNGFVHPQFFIAKTDFGGTVTGRLSCKRPALQTIPRGSDIRSVFRPRRGGGLLLEVDASQAELRVATVFSGDSHLMEMFQSRSDPHQVTADLCGVDRQLGKTINFASIYGVTWWGLVEKAGLTEGLAKRVAKTIKKEWSGLYAYFDEVKKQAVRAGEVSTPYGRWRRVPGAEPTTPRGRMLLREAANFVIQAPASDFVQTLGASLAHALEGLAVPVLSNHDGLYFDVFDQKRLQDVVSIILTGLKEFPILIEEVFGVELTVPFEWDMKVGPNLQEMKEWE